MRARVEHQDSTHGTTLYRRNGLWPPVGVPAVDGGLGRSRAGLWELQRKSMGGYTAPTSTFLLSCPKFRVQDKVSDWLVFCPGERAWSCHPSRRKLVIRVTTSPKHAHVCARTHTHTHSWGEVFPQETLVPSGSREWILVNQNLTEAHSTPRT